MELKLQVGVKIFLKNEDGKYLLVRRSPEKYPHTRGNWDIVGGRIEPGITLADNLRREVKEETNLNIKSEPVAIFAQDIILSAAHVVRISFVGEVEEGELILNQHENTEYKWMTIDEMKMEPDLDVYVAEILTRGLLK